MRIAISLLWVRTKKIGGVESYVRNLLDGFCSIDKDNQYVLICSEDNYESFSHYALHSRFSIIKCNVQSNNVKQTVLFELFKLDSLITSLHVNFCFVPNCRMPFLFSKNRYVIVVHDIQPLHFPEYFSRFKVMWIKHSWKLSCKKAIKVITISQYVKNDIIKHLNCPEDKIVVIYNPILPNKSVVDFEEVKSLYGISEGEYYYTISSLLKHKNLITLLRLMKMIKEKNNPILKKKLVISGVGGSAKEELIKYINDNNLEENCILTGYIPDNLRNTLIKGADYFLFPSIFEGFGMPVIESLSFGVKTITTKCTAIPEVIMGYGYYVDDPFNPQDWLDEILKHSKEEQKAIDFPEYNYINIANQYQTNLQTLTEVRE